MELTKRQDDIVQAAIAIIARRGFKYLTTKNLAQALGLTEAALYRHFESKSDLINRIMTYFEKLSCQILDVISTSSLGPLECVHQFVLHRYRMFSADPDLARVMFSDELFSHDPSLYTQMQKISGKHQEAVVGYLEEAIRQGELAPGLDPIQLFYIVVGSMRYTVTQWNMSGQSFDLVDKGEKLYQTIRQLIEFKENKSDTQGDTHAKQNHR